MVSILILNYNDKYLTEKYLRKIKNYKCIDFFLVVDNFSSDGSFEYLKKYQSDKIEIIRTEKNIGYANGNNFGLEYLQKKFGTEGIVIISNPDVDISEENIQKIIAPFSQIEGLFASTGQVYTLDGDRIPLYTWKIPSIGMIFVENSTFLKVCCRKLLKYNRRYFSFDLVEDENYYYGDALPGCFFAADLQKFQQLGYFSKNTFLYFEEDILFYKAKKKHFKNVVVKDAKLIHAEGVTTKKSIKSWRKKEKIIENSASVFLKECYSVSTIVIILYKIINRLFLPERYIFYRLKNIIRGEK